MKKFPLILALALLAACQSTPKLEDDTRYVKLAIVTDRHEFSEVERKQAQANSPSGTSVHFGIGLGVGSGGSFGGGFGGMMMGMGGPAEKRDEAPQIAKGAIRYTVQPLGSQDRVEVMSYRQFKLGECVKVLATHPSEYPRFFDLKPGERCD